MCRPPKREHLAHEGGHEGSVYVSPVTRGSEPAHRPVGSRAIEVNIFRGKNSTETGFASSAVRSRLSPSSAGRTVELGRVHSLHSYFLRPATRRRPSSTRSSHPRRSVLHYQARRRPSSTAGPSSTSSARSTSTKAQDSSTRPRCRTCPGRGSAHIPRAAAALSRTGCRSGSRWTGPGRSTSVRRRPSLAARSEPGAPPAAVGAHRWPATRRPAAACCRRRLRLGHVDHRLHPQAHEISWDRARPWW